MEQINNSKPCCATCAYWLGNRTPDRLGFVVIPNKMVKGQCSAHSLSENYTQQAIYWCRKYQKWAALQR